jgi:cytoskeletal protein RodZ
MITDAKKVGEIFRAKREEKRISLKEIESATSIRINYLAAIEEGSVDQFHSTVYFYGFMRQYAGYLGLDIEKMSRDFPEVFKLPKEKHEFAYGIGTLEMRGNSSTTAKWMPNIIWAVGVSLVVLLAYWLAKKLGLLV